MTVAVVLRLLATMFFATQEPSSDGETWKMANFLCIVMPHEERGLIRDKTLRISTGKDKNRNVRQSVGEERGVKRKNREKRTFHRNPIPAAGLNDTPGVRATKVLSGAQSGAATLELVSMVVQSSF
ncbi:hypothetical protein EYF80_008570 [Liparis tanakae]|uniref:Secreted protein n=1 Tax=Liparis tanakae TaxID=230148 RepID=A0A4Z2ITR3_9TELE|nr:hypothetical protein EYF80_008570 [Liparis tanakae]